MTIVKNRKVSFDSYAYLLLFVFFLLYQKNISEGMKDALKLCYTTVIPSLFPFMVLSDLVRINFLENKKTVLSKLFSKIFSCSELGFYPFIMGMLCGFPVGAKEICSLYKSNTINIEEANHLLGFVNIASPAFVIFGVGLGLRKSYTEGIFLYLIQFLATLVVARITSRPKTIHLKQNEMIAKIPNSNFPTMITRATTTMLSVCGMICIFSAFASIIYQLLPEKIAVFPIAILEIVNGTTAIMHCYEAMPILSFSLTAFAICFGGFSVHMQANLFIAETDLSFALYLKHKALCGICGFFMALLMGITFLH